MRAYRSKSTKPRSNRNHCTFASVALALISLLVIGGCKTPDFKFGLLADSSPKVAAVNQAVTIDGNEIESLVSQVGFDQGDSDQADSDQVDSDTKSGDMATSRTVAEEELKADDQASTREEEPATGGGLATYESIALQSHPIIVRSRARVQAAQGRYQQAWLPFNPVLQYQSEEIGNDDSSGLHRVTLSQQIVTANKLGLAQNVQAQEVQKQQAALRRAELQVLTGVRTAFAQALVAQERARLTEEIVELSSKSKQSVQSLLDAQEVSRVALLQVGVEAQDAKIKADNASTTLAASRRRLAAATGLATLPLGPLSGDLDAQLSQAPWEALVETLRESSPELAAAGSEYERAKWALHLACAQATPNVTGLAGVGVDTATDDTFASIGVSMPLPIRNRNQGNIRAARAEVDSAAAAIDQTRLDLESRLADAVGRYQMARERFERLRDLVLPIADETFQLSISAVEAGESSYLQLLTAQRTLFTTQLSALDALSQALQASAEIEGMLVTLK